MLANDCNNEKIGNTINDPAWMFGKIIYIACLKCHIF